MSIRVFQRAGAAFVCSMLVLFALPTANAQLITPSDRPTDIPAQTSSADMHFVLALAANMLQLMLLLFGAQMVIARLLRFPNTASRPVYKSAAAMSVVVAWAYFLLLYLLSVARGGVDDGVRTGIALLITGAYGILLRWEYRIAGRTIAIASLCFFLSLSVIYVLTALFGF